MSESIELHPDGSFSVVSQPEEADDEGERSQRGWAEACEKYRPILDAADGADAEFDQALRELSLLCRTLAQARELEPYYERRLAQLRASRHSDGDEEHARRTLATEAELLSSQGAAYYYLDGPQLALPRLEAALERHLQAGRSLAEFESRKELVRCYQESGQADIAYARYRQAAADPAVELEVRVSLLLELSDLQERASQLSDALDSARQAESIVAPEQRPAESVASQVKLLRDCTRRVVECLLLQEEADVARCYAERHLARARECGSAEQEIGALGLIVQIQYASGARESALQTLKDMLALAEARVPERVVELQVSLAAAYAELGPAEAACAICTSLVERDPEQHRFEAVGTLFRGCQSAKARQDWPRLLVLSPALRRLAGRTGYKSIEVEAQLFHASSLFEHGRLEEAQAVAAEGLALAKRYDEPTLEEMLASLLLALDDAVPAMQAAYASIERCIADVPQYSASELERVVVSMEHMHTAEATGGSNLRIQGLCLQCIAECLLRMGDEAGARAAAEDALARFTASADHARSGRLRERLAALLSTPDRP